MLSLPSVGPMSGPPKWFAMTTSPRLTSTPNFRNPPSPYTRLLIVSAILCQARIYCEVKMSRSYEQYCPLARALDVIGDRWTLLVLRELFFAPKRFTDLQQRLAGMAPNLLSKRLRELEAGGAIWRPTPAPPPP